MTLADPLPEDHLLEGLVWEEQANHLHWEGRGGEAEGTRERREGKEGKGMNVWGVLGRGGCRVGGGGSGSTNSEDGARGKKRK